MKKYRLHQFLSSTGLFKSKRELLDAIWAKEITVDDVVVPNPNFYIKPDKVTVKYKGKPLETVAEKVYLLINKPEGYLSSRLTDYDVRHNKKSVFELLSKERRLEGSLGQSLVSAGRLDENTSGLLIITNDGQLVSDITKPERGIKKTYEVVLVKPIAEPQIEQIRQGVMIKVDVDGRFVNYKTKPASILYGGTPKELRVIISEGKKREIRLMFEKVGNRVAKLKRIAIGKISLDEMRILPGEYFFVEKDMILSQLR